MNPSTGIPIPSFRCARWQTGLKPSATFLPATRVHSGLLHRWQADGADSLPPNS